jgi:hypothetical protein
MQTFLRVHERPGEYVHAAKKNSYGYSDGRKEINCSLETSAWTVVCYQQAREARAKVIMAGQLVTLQDPDSTTFLTCEMLVTVVTERTRAVMAPQFQLTSDAENSVGTHLLWSVEKDLITVGGPIHVQTDRITLRHLNTGLYLRSEPDGIMAVKGRDTATIFEFTSQAHGRGALQEDTAVQLCANVNGIGWVTLQKDVSDNNELDARGCELSHDKFSAIPFLVSASMLRNIGVDLYVAVQGTVTLREFDTATKQMMGSCDPALNFAVGSQTKAIFTLLDCLNGFLSNDGVTAQEEIDILLEKNSIETIRRRQTMSREQGLIDVVLDIIANCELGVYDNIKAVTRRDNSIMLKQTSTGLRTSFTGPADAARRSQKNFEPDIGKPRTLSEAQRRLSVGSIGGVGLKRAESTKEMVGSGRDGMVGVPAVSDAVRTTLRRLTNLDQGNAEPGNGSQGTMSQELAQSCLKLVLALVKGNHASQMHIADRFPVILNQVRNQDYAVQCVKEMLKDNLLMLQTKVRQREIDIFVKLLVEFEMSVTFLKLLQSTCSCPMGVDNTQRMVTYALFGGKTDTDSDSNSDDSRAYEHDGGARPVLIRLHANTVDSTQRKLDFTLEHSIYMPTSPSQYREVLGKDLLEMGLPTLYVSWHCEDGDSDFSMLHLYDTNNMVAFDTFCHPVRALLDRQQTHSGHTKSGLQSPSPASQSEDVSLYSNGSIYSPVNSNSGITSNMGSNAVMARNARRRQSQMARTTLVLKKQKLISSKNTSSYETKIQVLNFFVAQLYLVADLCLDRNYVSINTLEELYPYDNLLALLLTDNVPSKVKAAVCRMLRCMYVDKEPQVAAIFPRLIRTSVTLKGGQENSFQDHHMGSQYSFALLQQVISEYIRTTLAGAKCDEFSAELMDLLQTLINFGFYSTPEQIRDILSPLVVGLDIHKQLKGRVSLKHNKKYHDDYSLSDEHFDRSNSYTKPKILPGYLQRVILFIRRVLLYPYYIVCGSRGRDSKYRDSQVVPGDESGHEQELVSVHRYSTLKLIRAVQTSLRSTFLIWTTRGVAWQKRWMDITNSMSYLLLILIVVIISIIMLTLELFEGVKAPGFEIAILLFFALELSVRIYCFWFVRGKISLFYKDPFNWLDTGLVLLDIVLESSGVNSGSARAAQGVRAIRILRFLRLFRILRAARILRRLADKASFKTFRKIPARYSNISEYEAKSVISILKILTMIYDRIQDQNLGIFIKSFVTWFDSENCQATAGGPNGEVNNEMSFRHAASSSNAITHRSPLDVYRDTIGLEEDVSTQIPESFDGVLVDMLMYANSDLVESALNLLMVHKSKNQLLFQAAEKTQIIYSPQVEAKYKFMTTTLRELKRLAEKFEIWGELEHEAHIDDANKMNGMLGQLTDLIKVACDEPSLCIREEYLPDSEVQNLLLNLNAMPCFMSIQETLFDGNREAPKLLVANILRSCNEVIYWFVKSNPTNQEVAFQHLSWFFEHMENDVGSSMVIRGILQGNRTLIKLCPKKYIADCAQKIISFGRKPMYLDVYLGMTEMSRQMDCAVQSVENEISRHLTSREWAHKILLWCVSYSSSGYVERRRDMELVMHKGGAVMEADMSPNLRYHTSLVTLLASCNLGPKLQAIYPFEDVVHTIVDPTCVYPVKKALGLLLLEMITCGIDGIEYSEELWKFFDNSCIEMEIIQNSIKILLKDFTKNALSRIRTAEWLQIILKVVVLFFTEFELSSFAENNFDNETNEGVFRATTRTESQLESTIRRMFYSVKGIYQAYCSQLGSSLREDMKLACFALAAHCPNELKFDPDHDDASRKPAGKPGRKSILGFNRAERESSVPATPRMSLVNPTRFLHNHSHHNHDSSRTSTIVDSGKSFGSLSISSFFRDRRKRGDSSSEDLAGTVIAPTTQLQYRQKYQEFTQSVIAGFTEDQLTAVQLFESIPTERDNSDSDVRLEPLLKKLTSHIRSRFKRTTTTHRKLDTSSTNTTGWLLNTFRLMLERSSRAPVAENNHFLAEQQVIASNASDGQDATDLIEMFNENGVTFLCIDLLSVGIDIHLSVEAIQLLVMMLLSSGGHRPVQKTIYSYLKDTDSVLFFEAIKDLIDNLMVWCQKETEVTSAATKGSSATNASGEIVADSLSAAGPAAAASLGASTVSSAAGVSGLMTASTASSTISDMKMPPEQIVFRLLQLMCDGNYLPAKNLFRDQEGNSRVANIIESLATFIDKLSRQETHLSTRISVDVIKTMLKFMQGPCKGNQEHLIMHTELLVSLNRLMRTSRPAGQNFTDAWATDIETLRESIVDILLAAIEGQPETSVVFERVATTIELNVFHVVILPSIDSDVDAALLIELIEEYTLTKLQSKYLVFLESLGEMRGTLPTFAQEKIRNDIASVEIIYQDVIHNIYFYKPDIVKDISKASINSVTADIDCSAHERKLSEFLSNVSNLYREAKHQQYLRKFGVSDLWSLQNRLTWLMFSNAVLMNGLILGFYEVKSSSSGDSHSESHFDSYPTSSPTSAHHDSYPTSSPSSVHHDDGIYSGHHVVGGRILTRMAGTIYTHATQFLHASSNSQWDQQEYNSIIPVRMNEGSSSVDSSGYRATAHDLYMSPVVNEAIDLLTILQILLAAAVVFIIIVVRVPVRYTAHQEKRTVNSLPFESVLYTLADPLPIWYSIYLLLTFLALFENRLFLSLLLLDFAVLDPTTRHLLDAVKNPARQLIATLVIIVIVLNVFAGVIFYFYRTQVVGFDIWSMWESFKLGLSYGIRGEYGVSHEMTDTLGVRMIVDLAFYFIVLAILRHIFFAIIVDTFGQLREEKFERDQHANNSCFICGVHRHDFDRMAAAGNSGGFAHHRLVVHNTLYYLYYIMSIWQSDEQNDNGIEMHVRHCLRTGDTSWFPVGASTSSGHRHGGHGGTGGGGGSGAGKHGAVAGNISPIKDGVATAPHSEQGMGPSDRGGSMGPMLAGSTSNSSSGEMEMVNHILLIEQQLSRMIGGESVKLKSDFPLNTIAEQDGEQEEIVKEKDKALSDKDGGKDKIKVGTIANAANTGITAESVTQQSSVQHGLPAIGAQQQHQVTVVTSLNSTTQEAQLTTLTDLTSKIQDVGSVLRLVMNRLERIESAQSLRGNSQSGSSANGKKKSKSASKTKPSSAGGGRQSEGNMSATAGSADEADSNEPFVLRGPRVFAGMGTSGSLELGGTTMTADGIASAEDQIQQPMAFIRSSRRKSQNTPGSGSSGTTSTPNKP